MNSFAPIDPARLDYFPAVHDGSRRHSLLASLVSLLLTRRSPAAIAWLIVAVVVNPVDAHPFGALTHISKEIREVVPTLADCNPTPAILMEVGVIRVFTSTNHGFPCVVNRSMALSVLPACGGDLFAMKASAANSNAASKATTKDYLFGPAIASTKPLGGLTGICLTGKRDYQKSPKSLSDERAKPFTPHVPSEASTAFGHSVQKVLGYDGEFSSALTKTVPIPFLVPSSCKGNNGQATKNLVSEIVGSSHDVNLHEGLQVVRAAVGYGPRSARLIVTKRGVFV